MVIEWKTKCDMTDNTDGEMIPTGDPYVSAIPRRQHKKGFVQQKHKHRSKKKTGNMFVKYLVLYFAHKGGAHLQR